MSKMATEHIVRTPGVCGGKACIAGHRVRVMDIVQYHEHLGWGPDEILRHIPSITLSDVYAALTYYFDNRDEVQADIEENARVAEQLRGSFVSPPGGSHDPD